MYDTVLLGDYARLAPTPVLADDEMKTTLLSYQPHSAFSTRHTELPVLISVQTKYSTNSSYCNSSHPDAAKKWPLGALDSAHL